MEEIQIINYSFSEKYNMFVCSTGDFTFVYELGFPQLYEFVEKFEIQYRVNSVGYQQKNGFTNEHNKSKLQQVYMQHLTRTIEMIDWSVVDFILISNYTNVLLLPFVTERTEFSGFIYVTEAALEYIK
ncbi:Integrator complex subunit 9 [Zancudomyces culisetae]|uniref:Integrator complex subunit 9 n=1 Tax=Zancudomyces culisetae TaxID=1213189 RepID=A0A1R1PKS8_ZANCU|nr:Integrator complex subunit 9 [Zancudomyces culisetae]|eukprot:OMH81581.1 Integrator complex subunit 9 [Zancudomyces culisetae]